MYIADVAIVRKHTVVYSALLTVNFNSIQFNRKQHTGKYIKPKTAHGKVRKTENGTPKSTSNRKQHTGEYIKPKTAHGKVHTTENSTMEST